MDLQDRSDPHLGSQTNSRATLCVPIIVPGSLIPAGVLQLTNRERNWEVYKTDVGTRLLLLLLLLLTHASECVCWGETYHTRALEILFLSAS